MNTLPNASQARVDLEKITDYLLSMAHPDGRSKEEFFSSFGFNIEEGQVLIDALRRHGASNPVSRVAGSPYGDRYSVDGELETPDGRNPRIRTVWILARGSSIPRLITAHPIRRRHVQGT